ESSCCPGPPRAWLPSIPPEPRVGTGLAASTPPNTFPPTPEPVLISSSVPLPVALPPQMAWEVAPSRMTALAPWDPNYKAKAGPRLVWVSWEYLPPWPGDGAGVPREGTEAPVIFLALSTGAQLWYPVMCCEDVFLSDPLLPCGQRVPLYLSEASQQVMGSLKLLLPPPIMSPWVLRTPSPGCSTAWLSGPELIALTGLLQMSQGAPRPASSGAPTARAGPPDPVSDHPGPTGGPSCSHLLGTDGAGRSRI
uniref:Sin3A associated protein 25 n=1 Tax=Ursus americanus TaxID=9643 RepID=A0A452SWA2_URSAM